MSRRFFVGVLSLGLTVMLSARLPAAAAPLLTNGDFEGGLVGGGIAGAPISWTASGGPWGFDYSVISAQCVGLNPALYGNYFTVFNAGNAPTGGAPPKFISQVITTTPGAQYVVDFLYGQYNAFGPANLQELIASATDVTSSTMLNSLDVQDISGIQNDLGVIYKPYSFTFVALSAQTNIQFLDGAGQSASSDGYLDNISVTALATPELNSRVGLPAALFLGIGLMVLLDRRTRKAALTS